MILVHMILVHMIFVHMILGSHDLGSHDLGSHDLGSHDLGSHDLGSHDLGSHDLGSHDLDSHDLGSHDLDSHELSHDVGHEVGNEIGHGHIDHGHVDHHLHHSSDHDLATETDAMHVEIIHGETSIGEQDITMDTANAILKMGNHTPLNLIMSFYLLSLGAIGVSLYTTFTGNEIPWLILVIAVPLVITKLLSLVWQKLAQNLTYKVEQGMELVGKKGTVRVEVSGTGGLIGVTSELYTHELPVKSLYPLSKFQVGDQVYICDFQEGFYLVDSSPNSIRRIRLRTRGSVPSESGEPK